MESTCPGATWSKSVTKRVARRMQRPDIALFHAQEGHALPYCVGRGSIEGCGLAQLLPVTMIVGVRLPRFPQSGACRGLTAWDRSLSTAPACPICEPYSYGGRSPRGAAALEAAHTERLRQLFGTGATLDPWLLFRDSAAAQRTRTIGSSFQEMVSSLAGSTSVGPPAAGPQKGEAVREKHQVLEDMHRRATERFPGRPREDADLRAYLRTQEGQEAYTAYRTSMGRSQADSGVPPAA
jgi:hypothetical protein